MGLDVKEGEKSGENTEEDMDKMMVSPSAMLMIGPKDAPPAIHTMSPNCIGIPSVGN